MSYLRAEDILPVELIEAIQHYVNGKTIYIPSVGKQKWGADTDTKEFLRDRNARIYEQYQLGTSSRQLAEQYALSEKSIQRIVRGMRLHREE